MSRRLHLGARPADTRDVQDGNVFGFEVNDDVLTSLATAAPRRAHRRGKADLGGRLRVASILRQTGVAVDEKPERVAGSTNEVWRAGNYIVRVGFVPGAERLRREANLAELLPRLAHYPKVIASGVESFGEWVVVRRLPGTVLSEAWAGLDPSERRSLVHDFAGAMKAVHDTRLDHEQVQAFAFPEGDGPLALPHQLPAERILGMLDRARSLPHMDTGLIDAAAERAAAVADSIWAHERNGLVHGDLHFENVLVLDGVLVAVLDFEWCRPGAKEIDLDVLARFCAQPELHVGGDYPVHRRDFVDVLRWVHEVYPDLFAHDRLADRLMLCALAFEVPWLLAMPPTGSGALAPFHPVNQLRDLLDHGSHAERLGWLPVSASPYDLNTHR